MTEINFDLLKRLCEAPGVASREDQVRTITVEALRPLVDDLRVDALGNMVALKRGDGSSSPVRLMIAAHMDEIGFLVSFIDERGFLRLQPLGGLKEPFAGDLQQRVLVTETALPCRLATGY